MKVKRGKERMYGREGRLHARKVRLILLPIVVVVRGRWHRRRHVRRRRNGPVVDRVVVIVARDHIRRRVLRVGVRRHRRRQKVADCRLVEAVLVTGISEGACTST